MADLLSSIHFPFQSRHGAAMGTSSTSSQAAEAPDTNCILLFFETTTRVSPLTAVSRPSSDAMSCNETSRSAAPCFTAKIEPRRRSPAIRG